MAEQNLKMKSNTVRTWYPSSSQFVTTPIPRNLDLLTTFPRIERAEANKQTDAGQFEERAAALLRHLNFDSKRYQPGMVVLLDIYSTLINYYTGSPYFKTTFKIHG